jgi:(p)ppGpp synthase/HD superfamily hydrolase
MNHGIKHERSQALIDFAFEFAKKAHDGQVRKYTGEPYIVHPIEVANIVASVTDDCECICAALLHDVIEDCGVTKQELINSGFGFAIAEMVDQLSDISKPEDGNRSRRKDIDRAHTAKAWPKTKTVKLADLISNTKSITKYDKEFSKVYLHEKQLLLPVLKEGNQKLWHICDDILIKNGFK